MALPTNGTPTEIMVRHLTNEALAQRVHLLADRPRGFTAAERKALLDEAARRIDWHLPKGGTGVNPLPPAPGGDGDAAA